MGCIGVVRIWWMLKRKIKFVLLGRAVAERTKQGTHTTQCSGGWSEELGFIRIYPLHPKLILKTWNEYEALVERNPKDNRRESWKLQGRESLPDMYKSIQPTGNVWTDKKKIMIIPNLVDGCIMNLKAEKAYPGTEIVTGRSFFRLFTHRGVDQRHQRTLQRPETDHLIALAAHRIRVH